MKIVDTIEKMKENPRYRIKGKSIIRSQNELNPSNRQSIVIAIVLQRQNPMNIVPKNSRNKTNRPNFFLCFLFFICSPLLFCRMQSTLLSRMCIWKTIFYRLGHQYILFCLIIQSNSLFHLLPSRRFPVLK